MNYLKTIILLIITGLLFSCKSNKTAEGTTSKKEEKIVVAYVTSWSRIMPDPDYITHINYAFAHVTNTFDGVRIDNENRLSQLVELKKQKPSLTIILSIGGWGEADVSARWRQMRITAVRLPKTANG